VDCAHQGLEVVERSLGVTTPDHEALADGNRQARRLIEKTLVDDARRGARARAVARRHA